MSKVPTLQLSNDKSVWHEILKSLVRSVVLLVLKRRGTARGSATELHTLDLVKNRFVYLQHVKAAGVLTSQDSLTNIQSNQKWSLGRLYCLYRG